MIDTPACACGAPLARSPVEYHKEALVRRGAPSIQPAIKHRNLALFGRLSSVDSVALVIDRRLRPRPASSSHEDGPMQAGGAIRQPRRNDAIYAVRQQRALFRLGRRRSILALLAALAGNGLPAVVLRRRRAADAGGGRRGGS